MRTCLLLLIGLFTATPALAHDSMQWRNEPGFVCHSFSQYGLCNEWAPVGDQQYYFNTQIPYGAQIIPQQCGNPMQDCTGRVTVRASSNQGTVRHNDEYSYSLYVRNDDSQPRVVSVRAYLDDAVYYMNATAGARLDGSIVTWNSVVIPARSSRTLTLRVRVRPDTVRTSTIKLSVVAGSSSDTVTTTVYESDYYNRAIQVIDDNVLVRPYRLPYTLYTPGTIISTPQQTAAYAQYRINQRTYRNGVPYEYGNSSGGYWCDPSQSFCY